MENRKHELQHEESPTWCVMCGTFDTWCKGNSCTGYQGEFTRRFDTSQPDNYSWLGESIFGSGAILIKGGI